uniref:Uncharacterized protein n=1 Tax=Glossina palpalis gambiensis TaxID=67801 RepID=A0A1B0AS91_9MUSC
MIVTHRGIISKSQYKNDFSDLLEKYERENSKLKNDAISVTLQLRVTGLIVNRVRNLLHEAGKMHLESDEKEKPEINTQRQVNLSEQYEVKLQNSVQELRNQYEGQMEAIQLFNSLRCILKRIDARNKTIIELKETNAALSSQIQKLKQKASDDSS